VIPFAAPLLINKRVLVVEDESLVAMLIEDLLQDCGCSVVGPCGSVETALAAARTDTFDLAVLDVNLRGEKVYPVAELLAERQIPFLFLSGYGEEAIPAAHPDWKACSKPFRANDLIAMMQAAVAAAVH
jgi:CheY-like chemotaxis protein